MRLNFKQSTILLLLFCYSCRNENSSEKVIESTEVDLIGNFYFDTTIYYPKEENQNFQLSTRRTRELKLHQDSTFDEINTSYQAFDLVDYFGKWTVKENKLILRFEGPVVYRHSRFIRSKEWNPENQFLKELEILSENALLVVDGSMFDNDTLRKRLITQKVEVMSDS